MPSNIAIALVGVLYSAVLVSILFWARHEGRKVVDDIKAAVEEKDDV